MVETRDGMRVEWRMGWDRGVVREGWGGRGGDWRAGQGGLGKGGLAGAKGGARGAASGTCKWCMRARSRRDGSVT